jgi:predicted secreted protein
MHPFRLPCLTLLAAVAAMPALAQTLPPPQNVVQLSASASVEVAKDWLSVVFSTSRDGADAGTVQAQLKQALEGALAEARKAARPGQVEVQTGSFSLMPRYANNPRGTPTINGWQGTAELIVEGRDATAIAQLTGRIQSLTVARVGWALSREARQKVEDEVTAQAITNFRARAEAVSRQFGFAGYTLREVTVGSDGMVPNEPPRMRVQAMSAMAADAALPVEAGKATVTAAVNGSVQMTIR